MNEHVPDASGVAGHPSTKDDCSSTTVQMGDTADENVAHMLVAEGVIDVPTMFLPAHQIHFAQVLQLVGHSRLIHAQRRGEVADTPLAMCQGGEHPHTGWIGKRLKETRHSTRVRT